MRQAVQQFLLIATVCAGLLLIPFLFSSARDAGSPPKGPNNPQQERGTPPVEFLITSTAFANGADIPRRFTCDGPNISPLLAWTQPPSGTQALVLVMDDPDAPRGDWVHWIVYDIPDGTSGLPNNLQPEPELQTGARQGTNDFHKLGYVGPCPPKGKQHRYYFRLYALNQRLGLMPGALKGEVERAMQGHVIAKAELMGHYQKP
jgi:Raf kinase inhibitor-like YbhB/YbcL family protein